MGIFKSYLLGKCQLSLGPKLGIKDEKILLARKKQFNKEFIEKDSAHSLIRELLSSDVPAMVARYGYTEAEIVGRYFMKKGGVMKDYGKPGKWLYATAGFFSALQKLMGFETRKH